MDDLSGLFVAGTASSSAMTERRQHPRFKIKCGGVVHTLEREGDEVREQLGSPVMPTNYSRSGVAFLRFAPTLGPVSSASTSSCSLELASRVRRAETSMLVRAQTPADQCAPLPLMRRLIVEPLQAGHAAVCERCFPFLSPSQTPKLRVQDEQ